MDILQSFVDDFLTPFAGNPHLGLFLFVWLFSVVNPLAPPEEAFTLLGGACMAFDILQPVQGGLALIGGILATNISQYWLGRGVLKLLSGTHIGNRFIQSKPFRAARRRMAEKGIYAIIGCRFFFGARAPTYVATGFLRYRFWKFVAIDTPTVLVHGIPLIALGYLFAGQIDRVLVFVEKLGVWSLVALLALIAGFFGIKFWKNRRRSARAGALEG